MADQAGLASHEPGASRARLALFLLGPPRVLVDGRAVLGPHTPKALTLLAYLAVENHRPHTRSELSALLWPDQPAAQAAQNLRQALCRLHRAICDGGAHPLHLLSDGGAVQFDLRSDSALDITALQARLQESQRHSHRRLAACDACLSRLAQAVDAYRGDFLAGHSPPVSQELDEWMLMQRERWKGKACFALNALACAWLERGELDLARGYAERLLELEGCHEAAQRLLLRAAYQQHGRSAALRLYERFRREIEDDMAAEPEGETQALVAQMRAGTWHDPAARPPLGRLPAPPLPSAGRQQELALIGACLAGRERRLLTLYGPAGSGKTRLAEEIAARQARLWREGVWYVPLAQVSAPGALSEVLADALGVPGRSPAAGALLDYLRSRELLLILDGFQHPEAGRGLLPEMLRRAPEVRLLVTSRTPLGLQQEWALDLGGRALPRTDLESSAEAGS